MSEAFVELDVERRADWCHAPGQTAYLRVGPFVFGVATADGLAASFTIKAGRWWVEWSVGAAHPNEGKSPGPWDNR